MSFLLFLFGVFAFFHIIGRLRVIERRLGALEGPEGDAHAEEEEEAEKAVESLSYFFPQSPAEHPSSQADADVHADLYDVQREEHGEDERKEKHRGKWTTEEGIGTKLFPVIGGLAMLFGVGFFLKYAIDQNWITEGVRIFLGYLFGAAFVAGGELLRKKYTQYSHIISGIGVAILYIITFGAHSWYGIFSQPVAFAFAIAFSALGVVLSLRYDTLMLAGIGFAGGFLAPLLLPPPTSDPYGLFGYVSIISAALVAVAMRRSWLPLLWGGLAGSYIIYFVWAFRFYASDDWFVALFFSSFFFLLYTIFGGGYIVRALNNEEGGETKNATILALFLGVVGSLYFIAGYNITSAFSEWLAAYFVFGLGTFYAVAALLVRYRLQKKDVARLLFVFSVLLYAAAPAIALSGSMLVVAWSLEAVAIAAIGFIFRSSVLRHIGIVVAMLAGLHAFFVVDLNGIDATSPFFNDVFISGSFVVAAFSALGTLYYAYWQRVVSGVPVYEGGAEVPGEYSNILFSVAAFLFYVVGLREIHGFFSEYWHVYFVALASPLIIFLGVKIQAHLLRIVGGVGIVLAGMWLLVVSGNHYLEFDTPFLNPVFLEFVALILAAYVGAHLLKIGSRHADSRSIEARILYVFAHVFTIWGVSVEISEIYKVKIAQAHLQHESAEAIRNMRNVLHSVWWMAYALIVLVIGFVRKFKLARLVGLILLWITIFKVFLFDAATLDVLYRFISFVSLGAILLIAGFLYNKYREKIREFLVAE